MKIIIIGNSGSGKTWLANNLANQEKCQVINIDDIFWEPGGFDRKRSNNTKDLMIREAKKEINWIAEGVFGEIVERFFDDADTLIWLDIEWKICEKRLLTRGSESKKHLNRKQSQQGLSELLDWASQYYDRKDGRSYIGHKKLFDAFPGRKEHIHNNKELNNFLEKTANVTKPTIMDPKNWTTN